MSKPTASRRSPFYNAQLTKPVADMLLELAKKAAAAGPDAQTLADLYEIAAQAAEYFKDPQKDEKTVPLQ